MRSNPPLPVEPPKRTGYSRYWATISAPTSSLEYGVTRLVQLAGICSALLNVYVPSDCFSAPKNDEIVASSGVYPLVPDGINSYKNDDAPNSRSERGPK